MNIHRVFRPFLKYFRKRRIRWFEEHYQIFNQTKILDVGGTQFNWQFIKSEPTIIIINLEKPKDWDSLGKNTHFIRANGLHLPYPDRTFDVAYSNSVIEHLSNWENQKKFAEEIQRVGKSIYVQTPAKEFFIEPHLITPFIHWLPLKWQSRVMRNFTIWGLITRPSREYIDSFLKERRLLNRKEFTDLFRECAYIPEKFLFLTKSHIAVKLK